MTYRAYFDENRKYGVEIECYGLSRLEAAELLVKEEISVRVFDKFSSGCTEWTIGQDGTVNQNYPLEIISPPLKGSKGLEEIKRVCELLEKAGVKTDSSCGLHVHHHVSDFSGHSALNLLRLYAKYENILDFLFSPERRGDSNKHARSLVKQGGIDWIYALNKPFFYQAFQIALEFEKTQKLEPVTSFPSARHHKVNLCAINLYGTAEFRQHQGTLKFEEIKNWIIFSQQLILRAKSTMVLEGVVTWDSLIRTLALADSQLKESVYTPDKKLLRACREFYKEIYRANCHMLERKEETNAVDLGSRI